MSTIQNMFGMKHFVWGIGLVLVGLMVALWAVFGGFSDVEPRICELNDVSVYQHNVSGSDTLRTGTSGTIGVVIDSFNAVNHENIVDSCSQIKLGSTRAIVASFPYKGRLSNLVGYLRVYPQLVKLMKENGISLDLPVIKIVDRGNMRINYAILLEKVNLM